MHKLLRNEHGQLRNGWWILVFLVVLFVSQLAYRPVSRGLQHMEVGATWLWPLPVLFLLAVTWICLRLRGQPLWTVGLRLDGKWFRQALLGVGLGGGLMAIVALLIFLGGGVRFSVDPAGGLAAIGLGAWMFLWAALLEELEAEVRAAQREAEQSGTLVTSTIDFPQDVTTMFEDVFEEMPWHLREQQAEMVAELEAKRK